MIKFQSMELDDEAKNDLCIPCDASPNKKLEPVFPWGLRITLENDQLKKLGLTAADFEIGSIIHLHAMSRVTSITEDQRKSGDTMCRVELQIEQLACENEDAENAEAEAPKPRARLKAVYKP